MPQAEQTPEPHPEPPEKPKRETLMVPVPVDLADRVRAFCLAERLGVGMFFELAARRLLAQELERKALMSEVRERDDAGDQ